ncbi:hypothetical protein ANN_23404 [Periplaneta americana]|uniref:Ig-like domain-containing protein n=1 Tax=Periplaneta americana TaxID=6978 RepID=A0ABQ8SL22_PERAM|nr:hypothetical protein ANN_23404 [Periplaneta americana]
MPRLLNSCICNGVGDGSGRGDSGGSDDDDNGSVVMMIMMVVMTMMVVVVMMMIMIDVNMVVIILTIIMITLSQLLTVRSYDGETLLLNSIQRSDMGAYLCIANNGIPPPVSKRFVVQVHFHPLIKVSNQLVAAPVGSNVDIGCDVEASPKAMNSWYRDTATLQSV